MKRHFCTVAAVCLLALWGTATASATDLPGLGQTGTQVTSFGDQTVGEQRNDADVTQEQGNGNVAIAPAVAIGGDAETTNEQGNGNEANADVDQKNSVDQSQSSKQAQSLDSSGGGHCCGGSSQTAEQKLYGGDQTVGKQKNDADVTQTQGTGNVWIGPAIAIGGDAETRNYQGNGNEANADVSQKNDVDQSQSSTQKQQASREGGSCCESEEGYDRDGSCCEPEKGHGKDGYGKEDCCERGSSQTGEQKTSFGDQSVGEQRNDADVTQEQGNGNFAFAPAISFGGKKQHPCNATCGKSSDGTYHGRDADAETTNKQGNGNEAIADVDQKNSVDQTQTSYQRQELVETCKQLVS